MQNDTQDFYRLETPVITDMCLAPYGLLSKSSHLQQVRGFLIFWIIV